MLQHLAHCLALEVINREDGATPVKLQSTLRQAKRRRPVKANKKKVESITKGKKCLIHYGNKVFRRSNIIS